MKKCLSLLLILVMLVTSYGGALADTLKLPANLTMIGEEAFFGASSLDVVDIPWGTEIIGSKAFANSSVTKVYIPATVYSIADDAFEETNITICAPMDSYAYYYAQSRNIPWIDSGNRYDTEMQSFYENPNVRPQTFDSLMIELLNIYSTEDETDPELLAFIQEINESTYEMNLIIEEYNNGVEEYQKAVEDYFNSLAMIEASETDSMVSLSFGSSKFVMDKSVQSAGSFEWLDNEETASDDGDFLSIVSDSGKTYYFYSTGETFYLTASVPKEKEELPRAVLRGVEGENPNTDTLEILLSNGIGVIEGLHEFEYEKSGEIVEAAEKNLTNLNRISKNLTTPKAKIRARELEIERGAHLEKAVENQSYWRATSKIMSTVNIAVTIAELNELEQKAFEIKKIQAHGHPLEIDYHPDERYVLACQLKRDIEQFLMLYKCDAALSRAQLISSVFSIFNAFTILPQVALMKIASVAVSMASTALQMKIQFMENELYSRIMNNDPCLHCYVYGKVTDSKTQEYLNGVPVVIRDDCVAFTDQQGDYEMYLLPGNYTLKINMKDYKPEEILVSIEAGKGTKKDIQLVPSVATVYGTAYDIDTMERLPSVYVSVGDKYTFTDANGDYELPVSTGNQTWRVVCEGYVEVSLPISPVEGESLRLDAPLTPEIIKTGTIYGYAYNSKTKEKLSEVEVYVGENTEPSVLTDENGYYSLTLPTKEVQLTFKKEGYNDYPANVTPVYEKSVKADAPMVQQFGTVCGYVTDEFGEVLSAAVRSGSGSYITSSYYKDGWYSCSLPVGTQEIIFTSGGYVPVTKTIHVHEGENPLDASLPWAYGLRGKVVDETGAPVTNAHVWIFDYHENVGDGWYNPVYSKYTVNTNGNGEFRIHLTPGEYYTKTAAGGYVNEATTGRYTGQEITVTNNGITEMTAKLTANGKYCVAVSVTPGSMYFDGSFHSRDFSGTISYGNHSFDFTRFNASGNTCFYCISNSRYVDFHINGTLYYTENDEIACTISETKTIDLEGKDGFFLP